MEKNSMLLSPGHSEFLPLVTGARAFSLLALQGKRKLTRRLTDAIIRNFFSLRETVRFCTHLLTGISKQVKIIYRSQLAVELYCAI
jgi:hypothetical protein